MNSYETMNTADDTESKKSQLNCIPNGHATDERKPVNDGLQEESKEEVQVDAWPSIEELARRTAENGKLVIDSIKQMVDVDKPNDDDFTAKFNFPISDKLNLGRQEFKIKDPSKAINDLIASQVLAKNVGDAGGTS